MLIVYGILFIVVENYQKEKTPQVTKFSQLTIPMILIIGVFQMLALIPGTSRSGATIVGALMIGVSRSVAAEYTFFLAIPVMFGASLLKLIKFGFNFTAMQVAVLLVGMVVSFAVSIVAIKFLMSYIRKNDFQGIRLLQDRARSDRIPVFRYPGTACLNFRRPFRNTCCINFHIQELEIYAEHAKLSRIICMIMQIENQMEECKHEKVIGSSLNGGPYCRNACGMRRQRQRRTASSVLMRAAAKTAKVIDVDLTNEEYAFGVDKSQPELLEQVNAFIAKIQEDGTLDEIFDKYFGGGEPTPVESAALDESKDQLVVATNAAFEPFEYMEGENYVGIDMEIAALLAEELGQELVIQNMDFDAVCLSVGQQKCDIAMAGLTVSEDRKEYVTFSDTYYQASQRLIVPSDDTTFDDMTDADSIAAALGELDSSVRSVYSRERQDTAM